MTQPTNYKFHSTGQFRNVVKNIKHATQYLGFDEETQQPIMDRNAIAPKIMYVGTVKLHGTNGSVVKHEDGTISFHSKNNLLGYIVNEEFTLLSDNAEFAQSMYRRIDSLSAIISDLEERLTKENTLRYPLKISGEWCGCFHKNTPILLSDGTTKKIGKIVKDKLPVEVMSYNHETGNLEPKKVINWFDNGTTDDWLTIHTKRRKRGGKSNRMIVTPNHKIFSERNNEIIEVSADELSEGDIVYTQGTKLTREQEQVILGTLLGDGSFSSKNHIQVAHSLQQKEYLHYKQRILGGKVSNKVSGFGSKMLNLYTPSYPEISDIQAAMFGVSGKQPCKQLLKKLSPLALAILYMDDGSLITHKENGRQPRAELSVQGFTKDSVELLKSFFNEKGYYCNTTKVNNGCGLTIRFTPEGTHAFLSDITPYVLKSLRYKVPEYLRDVPFVDITKNRHELGESLLKTYVTKVEVGNPYTAPSDKVKYDIEVEDNHNYFANGTLVHNSGIQKGVGISFLDKRSWFIFGIKSGETNQEHKTGWLTLDYLDGLTTITDRESGIYSITDFPVKTLMIDFQNPEYSQNKLVEFTESAENCCPVSEVLDLKDAEGNPQRLGEGYVWTPTDPKYCWDSGNFFKTKGKKHSVSKVESVAAVCPEKLESIQKFVEYAVTDNRLEQGIQEVGLDQKFIGQYIGWVNRDINKEEADTLEASNLSMKDVGKKISDKARAFYLDKLNNNL